jgi:hypothetical protein
LGPIPNPHLILYYFSIFYGIYFISFYIYYFPLLLKFELLEQILPIDDFPAGVGEGSGSVLFIIIAKSPVLPL